MDRFKSNLHVSLPSEKQTARTVTVEAIAVLGPRDLSDDAAMTDVGGIQVEQFVVKHWEYVERKIASMSDRLRELADRRGDGSRPRQPVQSTTLEQGTSPESVGIGTAAGKSPLPPRAKTSQPLKRSMRLSSGRPRRPVMIG